MVPVHHAQMWSLSGRRLDAGQRQDATDARSIAKALVGEFDAVFYTVDIHGLFKPRKDIRAVMFQGCVNAIHSAAQAAVPPKFVLLSVIGPDRPSWVWWILNASKPGMQRGPYHVFSGGSLRLVSHAGACHQSLARIGSTAHGWGHLSDRQALRIDDEPDGFLDPVRW